jgi:sulfide:quinone oxidoreductase
MGAQPRSRVLIAGAGVAGLEALLALDALAGDRVEIELISPTDTFVHRPLLVAEPFGVGQAATLELAPIVAEAGASHRRDALEAVDPKLRTITTASGSTLAYDALLVCLGAHPIDAVPGSITFATEEGRTVLDRVLSALGEPEMKRIAFIVPRLTTWSIAAYELALLTAAKCQLHDLSGVELHLVTHESAPLAVFGEAAAQLVAAQLAEAGVLLRTSSAVECFDGRELRIEGGDPLAVDAAVALPGLEVPPIAGLPQRSGGFVHTDISMHVSGLERVWAAGDVTSFPVKQGGLAAQQADVAARSIAAHAGAHVPIQPFDPVLRGALITGQAPQFLRARLGERDAGEAVAGRPLWRPPQKLAGQHLGPFLERAVAGARGTAELRDLDPPLDPAADEAKRSKAVRLALAAAEDDARACDYASALEWLALVERLELVIPAGYAARRDQWRRELARRREVVPGEDDRPA